MSNTIIVTFTDPTAADQAWQKLNQLHHSQRIKLRGALLVLKDADDKVTIEESRRLTTESDSDAMSGPVANAMLSSHLGGTLLGGQAGALAGMTPTLRIGVEGAEAVAARMPPTSSALLFEYSDGHSAFIAAIIRDLDGHPYAIDVTDETKSDLEAALRGAGS